MRKLIRDQKGTAALATAAVFLPIAGVIAFGGEAGTWYITKQRAQNAADAAAYAGAINVACKLVPTTCKDTATYDYRGKEIAAQNAFCNYAGATRDTTAYPGSKCPASLGIGMTQTVTVEQGTYSAGTWASSASGDAVRATITQTQPGILAKMIGISTVSISARAITKVQVNATPCALSLVDPINFGGSTNVSAPTCGMVSDNTSSGAVTFTGNGNTVNAPISAQGGCTGNAGATGCTNVSTGVLPTPDPLSAFNTAMSSVTTANFPNGQCGTSVISYAVGQCYNNNTTLNSALNLSGVYFFTGNLNIKAGATITGTAELILLPGATYSYNGNPTITLNAMGSVSASDVPVALQSKISYMTSLLIYSPQSSAVSIGGSASSYFNGIVYMPNSDVTYTGNNTLGGTCNEVIAKGITFTGNSTLDNSGCPSSVTITSSYVKLVQ